MQTHWTIERARAIEEEPRHAEARLRAVFEAMDDGLLLAEVVVDGYQACRRIRSAPWGQGIRVVALSGWGQDEDRERSARAGFHLHLVKPLELDALAPVLGDVWPRHADA